MYHLILAATQFQHMYRELVSKLSSKSFLDNSYISKFQNNT